MNEVISLKENSQVGCVTCGLVRWPMMQLICYYTLAISLFHMPDP